MGPDRGKELYKAFAGASVEGMVSEFERNLQAAQVFEALSEEFSEMPVTSPVAEPTMTAKMHALSRLGFDQMGISGFNPMGMLHLSDNGPSMQAVAAPPHDRYEISGRASTDIMEVQTRAILIKPPTEGKSRQGLRGDAAEHGDDLEFFGLNMYAVASEGEGEASEAELMSLLETPQATSSSDIVVSAAARKVIEQQQRLTVAKGDPVLGVTNIFAVRHKEHGIVKMYGVTLSVNALPLNGSAPGREADLQLVVDLPNGMQATVTVLEGDEFNQALGEFARATEAIRVAKRIDPTGTKFSLIERSALRRLESGEGLNLGSDSEAPDAIG